MALVYRFLRSPWYVTLVMAIWFFSPEVRRIIDWRSTFHSVSILSILPLASLLPGLLLIRADWQTMGRGFQRLATVWLIAFGYAFAIAALSSSPISATYSLVLFCLPISFGFLLVAPRDRTAIELYDRFADVVLILMTISALYGIFQYVAPPAWDQYWAQQADIEGSQGETVAFGFRVFGTLNSSGPFAGALMLALLLNLPRLSIRRWWVGLAFIPIATALALTSVRACWVGVAIGVVIYLMLASHRKKALGSIAIVGMIVVAAAAIVFSTVPKATSTLTSLSDRISSFQSLDYDTSANDRKDETSEALMQGLSQPIGVGLGALGVAAKLSGGSTVTLDTGYLSRFLEMGVAGFALFIGALVTALVYAFKSYSLARRTEDRDAVDVIAVAIAVQCVFLFSEAIADTHLALFGLFFWGMVGVVSRYRVPVESPALQAQNPYDRARIAASASPG